jgi:hypothetical protein
VATTNKKVYKYKYEYKCKCQSILVRYIIMHVMLFAEEQLILENELQGLAII